MQCSIHQYTSVQCSIHQLKVARICDTGKFSFEGDVLGQRPLPREKGDFRDIPGSINDTWVSGIFWEEEQMDVLEIPSPVASL